MKALLSLPRKRSYVPIDRNYVQRYPWLSVTYFDDNTVRSISNPFHREVMLTLEQGRPRGCAHGNQTFQTFDTDCAEQFGPWDDGRPWFLGWEKWVRTWIEAIAKGGTAFQGRAVTVTELFVRPDRALYRPVYMNPDGR